MLSLALLGLLQPTVASAFEVQFGPVQQIGSSREIHENPRTKFVAEFIGNNNLFPGVVRSRSGSIVIV